MHRALLMAAFCAVAHSTVAFTVIPALSLPALSNQRAISPTLREFRLALGGDEGSNTVIMSRRKVMQNGVAAIGGIAIGMSSSADAEELASGNYKLVDIFRECKDLGVVRFLSVNPYGAVLEALGKLDYALVPFEIPMGKSKGQYVRIAGPNAEEHLVANFECSINLDNAATLAFDKLNGPTGELYSMRIMNADGEKILSILLNYDIDGNDGKPGKYYPGAVDKWLSLRSTYADINGDVDLRA
mmetsp:Transcript_77021/g.112770  ORF Transcript_77021/g.112770 Transcript_77021/m.112770 type:complete len:243 (-) Transcript_77021:219-947(-)